MSINIKFGIDPTTDQLHLGHFGCFRQLKAEQLSNPDVKVILVIGSFTATIGDPTDRDKTRPVMSQEETITNGLKLADQAKQLLVADQTEVVFNHDWFNTMTVRELLEFTKHVTVNQLQQKESFKKRLNSNKPITVQEFLYPILQAIDSVKLDSNLELGGSDQMFNILLGQSLQSKLGQQEQVWKSIDILPGVGTTQKMSKSLGNQINLSDSSRTIWDKILNIGDDQIKTFARILTPLKSTDLEDLSPRAQKEAIALSVLEQLNKPLDLNDFQKVTCSSAKLPDVLVACGVVKSKSEARQRITSGAVSLLVNNQFSKITDLSIELASGSVIQFGKRKFEVTML